jgi:hypothetical protein
VNINPFKDMRAVILRFYNKRLSESHAIEQNQENPMGSFFFLVAFIFVLISNECYSGQPVGAGWTA